MERIAVASVLAQDFETFSITLKALSRICAPKESKLIFILAEVGTKSAYLEQVRVFEESVPCAEVIVKRTSKSYHSNCFMPLFEIAINSGCNKMATLGRSEIPDRDWLVKLVNRQREAELNLVGGPVQPLAPPVKLKTSQRRVLSGISKSMRRDCRVSTKWASSSIKNVDWVKTNNWLYELDYFHRKALFDGGALQSSCGLNRDFQKRFHVDGGESGWEPDAVVHKITPLDSLTLAYQFDRAINEAMHYFRGRSRPSFGAVFDTARFVARKLMSGIFYAFLGVLDGGKSLVLSIRSFGMVVGCIKVLSQRGERTDVRSSR